MLLNNEGFDQDFLRLRAGDAKAYETIYNRYAKDLIKLASFKTSDKNVAEELVQNIFLSLWENREKLQVTDGKNYLFGALKFAVINHYRSLGVHHKYETAIQAKPIDEHNEILEHLEEKELDREIKSAISLLPNKTQEIFKLSRYEHQSNREISQLLNISEKTVEYHITQSLKLLRIHLQKNILTIFFLLIISTLK